MIRDPEQANVGSQPADFLIGPPTPSSPDLDIFISIERQVNLPKPYLCLAGRCNGFLIGTAGVYDINAPLGDTLAPHMRVRFKRHIGLGIDIRNR